VFVGRCFETRLNNRSLVAIGKVAKAFGLRGDVVILPMTNNNARFKKLKRVFVGESEATAIETSVTAVHVEQRGVRLRLASVSDKTAAEKFVGALVFVSEHESVRLPKGTFFVHDLIGVHVVDEEGTSVGVLKDVLKYPANDIYVVERCGNEVLIPAVKEFVKNIDLEAKTMRVKLIDGMLDESKGETDAD
jgi:16S rRNA processing protein RimM